MSSRAPDFTNRTEWDVTCTDGTPGEFRYLRPVQVLIAGGPPAALTNAYWK